MIAMQKPAASTRPETPGRGSDHLCVFATGLPAHAQWLSDAVGPGIAINAVAMDATVLRQRIALINPSAVVIDFSAPHGLLAAELAQSLRESHPRLNLVGLGAMREPASTLGALRAGVAEFVDMDSAAPEAVKIIQLAARKRQAEPMADGKLAMLLGARVGVGVTTLACNLSVLLRRALIQQKAAAEVALLDLGVPNADSLLYLDAHSEFSFVDAVRNLKRMDHTLAHTALTRHCEGLRLLPLPSNLAQLREISHADSVALVRRLRGFFGAQVADLGGFPNTDFLAQLLRSGDQQRVWMVCDQGVGSIVSTVQLLADLKERGVDASRFGLVVNRFDANAGMSARDIAERVGLALEAVIPARATQLLRAASNGTTLAESTRSDPYLDAVGILAKSLTEGDGSGCDKGNASSWWRRVAAKPGARKG